MKKVLIVDDAVFIRMMVKDALKDNFEIVGEATTFEEAVSLYEETMPDAVTMDISLASDKNGIDALKEIRAKHHDAVIIMVSSMGEDKYIKESIDAGAIDFIVKPFKKEDLLSVGGEATE